MRILTAVTIVLAGATNATAQGTTHKFTPTTGVQTFAVRPPVLRVKAGDTVETQTFSRPGDYYTPEKAGPWRFSVYASAPVTVREGLPVTASRSATIIDASNASRTNAWSPFLCASKPCSFRSHSPASRS